MRNGVVSEATIGLTDHALLRSITGHSLATATSRLRQSDLASAAVDSCALTGGVRATRKIAITQSRRDLRDLREVLNALRAKVSAHDAPKAIFQHSGVEIHQQTNQTTAQADVG